MQAHVNFNLRTAAVIDCDAEVQAKLGEQPIKLRLRSAHSRKRLIVDMTKAEALRLAAELYAATDQRGGE